AGPLDPDGGLAVRALDEERSPRRLRRLLVDRDGQRRHRAPDGAVTGGQEGLRDLVVVAPVAAVVLLGGGAVAGAPPRNLDDRLRVAVVVEVGAAEQADRAVAFGRGAAVVVA